jgi:hypothetical protein
MGVTKRKLLKKFISLDGLKCGRKFAGKHDDLTDWKVNKTGYTFHPSKTCYSSAR